MVNILEFNAKNNGEDTTQEIQEAIDYVYNNGGGKVVVPHGIFYTGSLLLKSNVELHLESGSCLKFLDSLDSYPLVKSRWEGVTQEVYRPCLYAEKSSNITISGPGHLEGNGMEWWKRFNNEKMDYPRPELICFNKCERIILKDVNISNSPSWTIHPLDSINITIDNISIYNPKNSPNTDGINPESCTNVRINNCNIDVGDDCIAIKSGTEGTTEKIVCQNIVINNCTMVHGHGGVVLGSEMSGGIKNVAITNCVFQDTDRGIRLKSRRGRGGVVEDVVVTNIIMENVVCPFILNSYYNCGPDGDVELVWDKNKRAVTEKTPVFRRLKFNNIIAKNVTASAGFIYGLPENPVCDISFTDVDIIMSEGESYAKPAMMKGIKEKCREGFFIFNANEIIFDKLKISNQIGEPIVLDNTQDVKIINS